MPEQIVSSDDPDDQSQKAPEPSGMRRASPLEIQRAIDEIVWFHGNDPLLWCSSVYQGLASKGILPQDINQRRLVIAQQRRDEELDRRIRDTQQFGAEISPEWRSQSPADRRTEIFKENASKERVIERLMDLKKARQQRNNGVAGINTNPNEGINMSETANILTVKESDLRAALKAIGLNAGDRNKWDLKRLQLKVGTPDKFNSLIESASKQADGAERDLLKNISDALADGQEVEVVADDGKPNGRKRSANKKNDPDQEEVTDVVKALAKGKPRQRRDDGPRTSRSGSLLTAAIQVLKKHKKPMKGKDIIEAIEKEGLWQSKQGSTPGATLTSALYMEIIKMGDNSRFEKGEEKGTFRLKKGV